MPKNVSVVMPQMGEGIVEATVVQWHKAVGDAVREGETLLDITTAKVDVEVPSPADGVLAEIRTAVNETVPVDTVIAILAPPGTKLVPGGGPAAAAPAAAEDDSARATAAPAAAPRAAAPVRDIEAERRELIRERSSPLVRAFALEKGIDLSLVHGTGMHGRVTRRDLEAYLSRKRSALEETSAGDKKVGELSTSPFFLKDGGKSGAGTSAPPERQHLDPEPAATPHPTIPGRSSPPPTSGTPIGRLSTIAPPDGEIAYPGETTPDEPGTAIDNGSRTEPMSRLRRQIAEHMARSYRRSPHAFTIFEVDYTRVERLRILHRDEFQRVTQAKLTPLVFLMKALAEVLPRFPVISAHIRNEQIVYSQRTNLGVAVAVPNGLVVPVIHDVGEMTMSEIATALQDKANRTRHGKLQIADIEGGTFTVTSPGQLGSLMGIPIIHQPQSAILHLAGIHKIPAVVEDADGNDVIAIRQKAVHTLGFDHRLIDGWEADSFMGALKQRIESGKFEIE